MELAQYFAMLAFPFHPAAISCLVDMEPEPGCLSIRSMLDPLARVPMGYSSSSLLLVCAWEL